MSAAAPLAAFTNFGRGLNRLNKLPGFPRECAYDLVNVDLVDGYRLATRARAGANGGADVPANPPIARGGVGRWSTNGIEYCVTVTETPEVFWATVSSGGAITLPVSLGVIPALGTDYTPPGTAAMKGISFAPFRDGAGEALYICTGTKVGGQLAKVTAALVLTGAIGLPLALSKIWVYNQRLYGVNWADVFPKLYWSAINNGDSIGDVATGGGSAIIRTGVSGNLVGGSALGETNVLFHSNGFSKFQGLTQDDIDIQGGTTGHTPEIGPFNGYSWVTVDTEVWMLSNKGLARVTETSVEYMDDPKTTPDEGFACVQTYGRGGGFDEAFVGYDPMRRLVWVVVPREPRILLFSTTERRWVGCYQGDTTFKSVLSPRRLRAITAYSESMTLGTQGGKLIAYSVRGGVPFPENLRRDVDDTIPAGFATLVDFPAYARIRIESDIPHNATAWRDLVVSFYSPPGFAQAASLNFTVRGVVAAQYGPDYGGASMFDGTGTLGLTSDTMQVRVPIGVTAPHVDLEFGSASGRPWTLTSLEAFGKVLRRRGAA